MSTDASLMLSLRGISKGYLRRRGILAAPKRVCALEDINLDLRHGETLGIVGSSGSGKSTLVRCAMLLEKADSGELLWSGQPLRSDDGPAMQVFRRQVQLVFQDSATAFNPRFTAVDIVNEPLLVQRIGSAAERRARAVALMHEVGLAPEWAQRRASQLSGGQRQRLAIARALALQPRLIFLDEALSGLDLSTQAQIANLLLRIQQERGVGYALVSHDMKLVARLADRVAVMNTGRIVEQGAAAAVLQNPQHAETKRLLGASSELASRMRAVAAGAR